MVGAGFSKNAKIPYGQISFPQWHELGNIIYERMHGKKPGENGAYLSVTRLAEEYEAAYGRAALDQLLKESIPDKQCEYSNLHVKLLELPWADIFTTNYDTFLESATLKANSRKYDFVTTREDLVFSRSPRIVKLHGSFPSQRPFIVTEEDYRRYPDDFSFFVNTVQQSLIENLFCLIGFSGDDPNFLHWIGWIRDNLGKYFSPKIYMLGKYDKMSEAQRMLLERRNIIPVDLSLMTGKNEEDGSQRNEITHADVYDNFFEYLKNSIKSDVQRWGSRSTAFPSRKSNDEIFIYDITREWKKERKLYPGWVIPPFRQRNNLWYHTNKWIHELEKLEVEQIPLPLLLDLVYELCWRFEQLLYPLFGLGIIKLCEHVVKTVVIEKGDVFDKWFEIVLSLLRTFRVNCTFQKTINH